MNYDFSSEDAVFGGLMALLGGAFILVMIIALAAVVVILVAAVKIYKKAGKAGWEAIVPYYNSWVLCEIAGMKWYFFLGLFAVQIFSILGLKILIPIAGLVQIAASFCVNYNLAKKFGKDPVGYGIGISLLPIVFYPILAFGSATYQDVKVSSYGPIPEETIEGTTPKTETEKPKKETSKKGKFCKNCGAEVTDSKFCPNCGTEIH